MSRRQTLEDVLDRYLSTDRFLTDRFVGDIPWDEIDPAGLAEVMPVLPYFLRTELSTVPLYLPRTLVTRSGRHPIIRQFLVRWGEEEGRHGRIFVGIARRCGIPIEPLSVPSNFGVPTWQRFAEEYVLRDHFIPTHMVWGVASELMTRWAYGLLIDRAKDPLFRKLMAMIMREESIHLAAYKGFARALLAESPLSRVVARQIVGRFWAPVGNEENSPETTRAAIRFIEADIPDFARQVESVV